MSCIKIFLEKHIVFRTNRLMRVLNVRFFETVATIQNFSGVDSGNLSLAVHYYKSTKAAISSIKFLRFYVPIQRCP
jgi:hypothetical protein